MEEWTLISSGNPDWLAYVFSFNFLLFVFCKWRYHQQFYSFFRIIDTPFYFNSYAEKPIYQQGFFLLSILFSIITIGVFVGFYLSEYHDVIFDLRLFWLIFLGITGVVIARQLAVIILEYFFEIQAFVQQYQFRVTTYLFRLSILMFIGLILYQYTFAFSPYFFNGFFLIVLLCYGFYHVLVIKQLFSMINQGGLYFILYLCTLEIGPFLVFYKVLNRD